MGFFNTQQVKGMITKMKRAIKLKISLSLISLLMIAVSFSTACTQEKADRIADETMSATASGTIYELAEETVPVNSSETISVNMGETTGVVWEHSEFSYCYCSVSAPSFVLICFFSSLILSSAVASILSISIKSVGTITGTVEPIKSFVFLVTI